MLRSSPLRCNWQYVVIEVDESVAGLTRDQLVAVLDAENVRARRYFWPGCHRLEPYRSYFPNAGRLLSGTGRVADRVVVLPTGTAVGGKAVATICKIIGQTVAMGDQLCARLHASTAERAVR